MIVAGRRSYRHAPKRWTVARIELQPICHEAALIPALGAILAQGSVALRKLIAAAVAPDREPTAAFVDAAFVLLDYPAWQDLTRSRSSPEAARIAVPAPTLS